MEANKVEIKVSRELNNVELDFGGDEWVSMTIEEAKQFVYDLSNALIDLGELK